MRERLFLRCRSAPYRLCKKIDLSLRFRYEIILFQKALFLHADAEVARRKKGRGKNVDIHLHLAGSSSDDDDDAKVKGKVKGQSDNRDRGRRQDRQVIDLLKDEEDDEEEEEEEVFIAWWQRKWRRQLVAEAESGWHLARCSLPPSANLSS